MKQFVFATMLAIGLLIGCGGPEGPELAPVQGVVTLDGAPFEYAQVMFNPSDGQGRTALATTDAEGKYTLAYTSKSDGALLGPHSVTISKIVYDPNDPDDPGTEVLQRKYQQPGTLSADVTQSDYVFDFEVEAK